MIYSMIYHCYPHFYIISAFRWSEMKELVGGRTKSLNRGSLTAESTVITFTL